MKRPKDFQTVLGGELWAIHFARKSHPKLTGAWGICYWDSREIYVRYDLSERNFLDTLIHEFQHALSQMHFSAEGFVNQTSSEIAIGLRQAGFVLDVQNNT